MTNKYPDILNEFIYYLNEENLSKSTIKAYSYDITLFFKYMSYRQNVKSTVLGDNVDISNFNIDILRNVYYPDIMAFIKYVKNKRNNSQSAINRKISCLKTFYHYIAYEKRYIDFNPSKDIKYNVPNPNNTEKFQFDYYSVLIDNIKGKHLYRDKAIISLLVFSAVKLNELINIKMQDIDFELNAISIKGNNKKERKISLNKNCMDLINEYINKERTSCDCDFIFISQRKKQISPRTVQHIIKTHNETNKRITSETLRGLGSNKSN